MYFQYSIKGMMLVITLGCFCLAVQEKFADALFEGPRVTAKQIHQATELFHSNPADMEAVRTYEHIKHEALLDRWDRGMAYVGFFCVFQLSILLLVGLRKWTNAEIDRVQLIGAVILCIGILKLLC